MATHAEFEDELADLLTDPAAPLDPDEEEEAASAAEPASEPFDDDDDELIESLSNRDLKPVWGTARIKYTYGDNIVYKKLPIKGGNAKRAEQYWKQHGDKIKRAAKKSLGYAIDDNQVLAAFFVLFATDLNLIHNDKAVWGKACPRASRNALLAALCLLEIFDFNQLESIVRAINNLTRQDETTFFAGA